MGKKSRTEPEPTEPAEVEDEGGNGDGHVDEFDESEEFDEDDLVTITDEEGTEYECAILGVLEHEGAEFALLAPIEQLADDDGDAVEMFIFSYTVDDEGNQVFGYIDDDALYEQVKAEFALLVNQEE
jgi:uncharacterized protein YrzB (UPF0473 family)